MALLALAGVLFLAWVVVLGPAWGPEDTVHVTVPVSLHVDADAVAVTGPGPGVPVVLRSTCTELGYVPRTAWERWSYGLAGLGMVAVGMYPVRLLHGVVDSIGKGEPFAEANAARFRRGGWITVALTVFATAAKYRGGRALIGNLDVMMARRRIALTELSQRVGITMANLSTLKNQKARAVRFSTPAALCEALECQPGEILVCEED